MNDVEHSSRCRFAEKLNGASMFLFVVTYIEKIEICDILYV